MRVFGNTIAFVQGVAVIGYVGLAGCASQDPQMCVGDTCVPDTCTNGIMDMGETDVDCGGPDCIRCHGGMNCVAATDCLSGQCLAETEKCTVPLTLSFADAVVYDSMFKPYVMLSGDLDGDGDVDLAAGNEESSTVLVFRNDGSGVFAPVPAPTDYGFPTGEYPTGGAIVDLNRDGVADVITADYHGNSVSVLLGQGAAETYQLRAPVSYPTVPGAETSNLALGDFNGDGIVDVIATNPQAASVSLFIGRANGTLSPAVNIALHLTGFSDPPQPYSVATGDFNRDGKLDAAIADNTSGTVFIELGNGDGTFRAGTSQRDVNGMPPDILIARDMDLDGNLDLIVANRSSDDVSVLLGHGDGAFSQAIVSSTGVGTGPYSLAVADFNLDGLPDVITSNWTTGNASILLGIGHGHLDKPIDAGATGADSYGVTVGDFNGDGKPDFATANASANNVAVKMNTAH